MSVTALLELPGELRAKTGIGYLGRGWPRAVTLWFGAPRRRERCTMSDIWMHRVTMTTGISCAR